MQINRLHALWQIIEDVLSILTGIEGKYLKLKVSSKSVESVSLQFEVKFHFVQSSMFWFCFRFPENPVDSKARPRMVDTAQA